MDSRSDAGLPVALIVSVLLMVGVAAIGVAVASPAVLARGADSTTAPQEPTVAAEEPEEGEQTANETYLSEALGSDFEIEGNELVAEGADGLPEELTAFATVRVQPTEDDELSCDDDELAPGDDGIVMTECEERIVNGGTVLVSATAARHSASGSNFGETTVRHLRADGNLVRVQLSVLGRPSEGGTTQLEEDVSAWLESLEEALISAALDDRMRAYLP